MSGLDSGAVTTPRQDAPRAFHVMARPTGPICNSACDYCFFFSTEVLSSGEASSPWIQAPVKRRSSESKRLRFPYLGSCIAPIGRGTCAQSNPWRCREALR